MAEFLVQINGKVTCIREIEDAIYKSQINNNSKPNDTYSDFKNKRGEGLKVAEEQLNYYSNDSVVNYHIDKAFLGINLDRNIRKFTAVSLFCGAGGLDLGFEQAGFTTLWANDFNSDACETHRAWSGASVVCSDITQIDASLIPESDIILGGFPCQGFSLSGPRKVDDVQTFPKNIVFYGDLISKYKQIGNSVPVALANHVAYAVRTVLEKRK